MINLSCREYLDTAEGGLEQEFERSLKDIWPKTRKLGLPSRCVAFNSRGIYVGNLVRGYRCPASVADKITERWAAGGPQTVLRG
jgi:hypothetical protein